MFIYMYMNVRIYIYVCIYIEWYLPEIRIPQTEHFSLNFNGTIRYND